VVLAIVAYTLSDNDLPAEFRGLLQHLRLNPERRFFADLAIQIGKLTEAKVLWAAAGTLFYSLFSLVEGVGLILRVSWAGWLGHRRIRVLHPDRNPRIGEESDPAGVPCPALNVLIVWYLLQNRHRLFRISSLS
jgi:uncharacterized membrane protein (DUF2068 family)